MASTFQITAELNLVNSSSVRQAVGDLQRQLRGATIGVNTEAATAGLGRVTTGAQASAAALRQMQAQAASTSATLQATVTVTGQGAASLRNFGEQAGLAARRFAAFSVAAGSMLTVVRGIQEGVRAAVEFGLSLNKVQQVSDEAASKVGALRTEIGSLSTSLGVSSAALAETAITLKQAGLSIDQTKDALKALALTDLAPTFDNMKQSTEGLIAAFRQFELGSSQFETTLSSMNAVAGKFAVESSDIISAVQRAGGAFKLSAGDMKSGTEALNEFMALFTSVRATTRESADSIATGLRTVFTRFQRQDTVKALGDLGINLRYTREEARALGQTNLTDQFVGAYEAVRRLSEGLQGLRETDPRYSQVVEQLGGYRQISRVVPLLKEFKTAEEAKNVAVAGGISLQLAAEKRQESLSNRISKLKEEYLELFRKITESKSFQSLANTMLGVASSFAKVLDYARPLLPLLTTLAAVKIGANLGTIAGSFTRAFVAPPGALVSGTKAGNGVTRFASGGHVPGSGNTDTVNAVLTPGEFVLKKRAAERIGYHKLHAMNERPERFADGGKVDSNAPTGEYTPVPKGANASKAFAPLPAPGPRKPLGPRANDSLIQALTMLTAPGRKRFADGGRVAPKGSAEVLAALKAFSDSTGIPYQSLVSSVRVSGGPAAAGLTDSTGKVSRGSFNRETRLLTINRDLVKDADQLRRTVFHELGHGLDLRIGGGKELGSSQTGTPAALAAGAYSGRLKKSKRVSEYTERYAAYATSPTESFAEAVAETYAGAGARGQSLLTEGERQGFERRVVAPARAQINYGFIDPTYAAKRRASAGSRTGVFGALFANAAKLFGYANGGFVPGAGNNDTEPAMLMPGEFVLNKGAVAKLGVPALRDLNEGRSRFRIKGYAAGSKEPVGGATPETAAVSGLAAAANKAADALVKLSAPTPPPADTGRGQSLLARLKAKQGPAPKLTDDIPALSFEGVKRTEAKAPVEQDVPFVSVAADVHRDSEDKAEAAREKRARAFFEKQNGGPAPEKPSFISQLKTDEQKEFFAKYAYGQDGAAGLAPSVANRHAQRFGDLGRAGIASGAVEDASLEAVAQLAVAPPKDFDPKHAKAEGYVVRHVQNSVRSRLGTEYGSGGKRFGGYVPTDADGNAIETAGREQDPSAPIDHNAALASAKAREAERARQLEQVRAVLPANALSGERDDRVAALRSLGASYKDASLGAADKRYTETLAGHLGGKLGVTPPGATPPPNDGNFVGQTPGGGGSTRPRDGTHTVALSQVEEFGKALGLTTRDIVAVRSQILAAANQTNKAGHLTAGLSDAALEVKGGRFARVAGVVNNASVNNPLSAQVNKFVREGEKALPPAQSSKPSSLTGAEHDYQIRQLAAAKQRYGDTYGRPGDEVNGGETRFDARRRDLAQDTTRAYRNLNRPLDEDPLEAASRTRRVRFVEEATRRSTGEAQTRQKEASDAAAREQFEQERTNAAQKRARVTGSLAGQREVEESREKLVDIAQFTTGTDGANVLSGGLLKERIDQRASNRIAERGGDKNLSDGTKDAIRQQAGLDEEVAVRRELISAQKNLLKQLNPEMSAHERAKKALEDVEQAMKGLAKVSKDSSGKLLGLTTTVDAAFKAGIQAPGAGGRGYAFMSGVGDNLAAARDFASNNKVTRLNERLSGFTQGPGFGIAAAGVGFAGSIAADKFDRRAGSAEDAAKNDVNAGKYTTNKAAGGALQGATVGAAVGAAGGPVGIAVGAVVGGLAGLYTSLQDAAKDIRQAKINNALTELGDKLSAFATGIPDSGSLAGLRTNLTTYRTKAKERATEESEGGLASAFLSGDWYGDQIDGEKYRASIQDSNRKELGPLLPRITQGLTKQAEALGTASPSGKSDDLIKELRKGAGGINAEFIRLTAELRGVPVSQVEDEFKKALVSAQQRKRVEDQNKAAKSVTEQQANTFGRLLQSVQAAADSLYGLQQRASALTDVLDGNITASRVSAHTERLDEGLGRLDGSALKPLDIVAAATGGYGASLRESGAGTDAVARALPSVLASVAGGRDLSEDNVTQRVSDGIYRNLGYAKAKDAPESIQKAVTNVIGGLNEAQSGGRGIGGVTDEIRTDATKFSDKLLSGAADPIKEYGSKIAKQLEDNGNRLVEGLTSIHQRLQNVGQMYDQLANLKTSNFRQNIQTWADNTGRGNQALDFASVQDLEFGANQKQQRLAGVAGAAAFDPRLLGQQLAQVRGQIGAATERQQAAFETTGGKGPEFGAAAEALLRLKDRAANLQQALKNLSDVAERNAVIQEKLNRIKQEEDGRTSLGERFLSADPAEQLRMNRGFTLANQAAQAGNLDGFGAEDRRLIIDSLKGAGGVTLTGFNGAPRADDLLKNLVSNSAGGAFQLTKDQKADKAALQGVQAGRQKTAEEAVAELISHQEAGSAELYRNLQQQQTQFFSKLERLLLGMKKADVENAKARLEADKGQLEEKGGARALLGGVGVNTTAQLEALRGKGGELEELRTAIAGRKANQDNLKSGQGRLGEFRANTGGLKLNDWLLSSNIQGDQAKRIQERTNNLVEFDDQYGRMRDELNGRTKRGTAERNQGLDAIYQKALNQAIVEEKFFDDGKSVLAARNKLGGIAGVDPSKIVETLSGPNADAFVKGLKAFDSTGNKIEDFGSKVAAINAELAKLDEQLKAINAGAAAPAPGGPAVPRAYGGDIFKPVGTDTVPAMLTPGEFVINARSASANAALLHQINEARGAVYLAGGGAVDDQDLFAASPFSRAAEDEAKGQAWDRVKKQQTRQRERDAKSGVPDARQKLYATYGGRDAYERAVRSKAMDTAAGDLVAAGQIRNFNRQAGAFDGTRRPGDEGQRAVANRVAAIEDRSFEERFKTDEALKRYTAARVGSQMVRTAGADIKRFAAGGLVGGAGTGDTVPSLLTPGEFVLNTAAVARLGAQNVQRFNQGGLVGNVSYLANGGQAQAGTGSSGGTVSFSGEAVKAMGDLSSTLAQFVQQAGGFGQAAQQLAQTFNVFAGSAQALAQAMNNMPKSLTITGTHQVNVVINGAEVMSKLTPEIQQMVTNGVKEQLGRVFKEQMPDAGIRI